jgi:hypothetical protein
LNGVSTTASSVDVELMLTESAVLPREMREPVGEVSRWTAGHHHHAERNAGTRLDHAHKQVGKRRQHEKVCGEADEDRPRLLGDALEVIHLQLERDPEHHEAKHGIQDVERVRAEVQPDRIDLGHLPFGSACIALK